MQAKLAARRAKVRDLVNTLTLIDPGGVGGRPNFKITISREILLITFLKILDFAQNDQRQLFALVSSQKKIPDCLGAA